MICGFFKIRIILFLVIINSKELEINNNDYLHNNYHKNTNLCYYNNINLNSEQNEDKSDNTIYKSCEFTSEDFNDFYKNNRNCSDCEISETSDRARTYVNDLFNDLLNNYNTSDNSSSIEIEKAFKFNKTITSKYILKYPKYIILLIFWILIFLLFFFFLICYLFNYFCFVPRNIETKQKRILIIISILCCGIFALSIAAYIENNYAIQGFYNMICRFFKIKEHLMEGDEYQNGGSWMGINKMENLIIDIEPKLISFFEYIETYEANLRYVKIKIEQITNNFLIYTNYTIPNPIPDGPSIISIINNYNNVEDINSFSYKKNASLTPYFKAENDLINEIENIYGEETIDQKHLNDSAKEAFKFFKETKNFYNSINITLNDEYFTVIDKITKGFTTGRIVLFWLALILSIFGIGIFILYMYKDIKSFIRFAWILFYIFMLITLVISFLFGFIGSYTKDLVYGIKSYLDHSKKNSFTYYNLPNMLVDKCLKGDGKLILDNYKIFKLTNNHYIFTKNINNLSGDLNKSFDNFFEIYNEIDNFYKNDIYHLIKTQTPELNEFLQELRKYTDASVNDSIIKDLLNYYDAFELSKDNCPEGYTYINASESLNKKDGKKYCFLIDEWDQDHYIQNRYGTDETKKIANYLSSILNYFNSYKLFKEKYQEIINKEIEKNNNNFEEFENAHNSNINNLKNILENLNFSLIFKEKLKDDESIFELTNCEFIQRDLYKSFKEAYYSFGMKLTIVSILHLIIGILETGLFIVYYILFANMVRDKKEVEEITRLNNDICGPLNFINN